MFNKGKVRKRHFIAAFVIVVVMLISWKFWRLHQDREHTSLLEMQTRFRESARLLIKPYQFPVALSSDTKRLLVKTKTENAFAFRVYQSGKLLKELNLDNPQWEVAWNPPGTAVSFLAEVGDTPGVYAPYVWWLNQDDATVLKGPTTNRASFAFKWSPNGHYVSYIAYSIEGSKLVILSVEEASPVSAAEIDDVSPEVGMAWSPNSEEIVFAEQNGEGFSIKKFNLQTKATIDMAQLPTGKLKDLSWSPSINTIAATFRGEDDNYFRLARIGLDGNVHYCNPENGDVLSPAGVDSGDTAEFILEKDSDQSIHVEHGCERSLELYHPISGAGRLQPDGYIHNPMPFIESEPDGPAKLIFPNKANSARTSTVAGSVSHQNGKQLWIPTSSYPVGTWIWEPDSANPPDRAIVMVHGGPHLHETGEWEPLREAFRRHGYIVMAPNYGGSSGYDKQYEDVMDLDVQADDVVAAIRYLTNNRHLPQDHISVFASSYGTRVLLQALRNDPDLSPVIIFAPFLAAPFDVEDPIPFKGKVLAFHGKRDPISNPAFAFASLKKVFPEARSRHRLYWREFDDEAHGSNRISSLQEEYGTIMCVLESPSCEVMQHAAK